MGEKVKKLILALLLLLSCSFMVFAQTSPNYYQYRSAVEYTPTFSLSVGYGLFSLSGNFADAGNVSNVQLQNYGLMPNLFSLEYNKDLSDDYEMQINSSIIAGQISSASGSSGINIVTLGLNLRRVWELGGRLKVHYLGAGINSNVWNNYGYGNGYEIFYGIYTEPLKYFGILQSEIGYFSLANTDSKQASGAYFKIGPAF